MVTAELILSSEYAKLAFKLNPGRFHNRLPARVFAPRQLRKGVGITAAGDESLIVKRCERPRAGSVASVPVAAVAATQRKKRRRGCIMPVSFAL